MINMRILQKITGFYYAIHEKNSVVYLILALFFVGVIVASAYISIIGYFRVRRKKKNGSEYLFGVVSFAIFSISFFGLFLLNYVVDMNFRNVYMFVWYPFSAVSCVVLLHYLKGFFPEIVGVVLLCAACFGTWSTGFSPAVQSALKTEKPTRVQEISEYVVDQGYKYIYGDWNIICPIATYTNGKVIAASSFNNPLEILEYINPQDVYGEEENKHAVYIFFEKEHLKALEYANKIGAKITLVKQLDPGYMLYTSDKQLMHYAVMPVQAH